MNKVDLIDEILSVVEDMSSIEEVIQYLEERKDELVLEEELPDNEDYYTIRE